MTECYTLPILMQNELTGEMIPEEKLGRVAQLANKQIQLEQMIEKLEGQLGKYKVALLEISTKDIPESMAELGLSEFTLTSGEKVKVVKFYSASIPEQKRNDAFKWLEDNEHDGIIKSEIAASFPKGEIVKAQAILKKLHQLKLLEFTLERNIHPQTLKAFVKEMCNNADTTLNFPRDLFGVFEGKKTTIETKK